MLLLLLLKIPNLYDQEIFSLYDVSAGAVVLKLSDIRIIKSHLFALACLFVSGLAASQGLVPQVSNDSAVVTLGSEVVVDILANDTGDINPSTVATYVPQQPSFGYLGINSQTGSITYTPYIGLTNACLLYTSPSPRDRTRSRMPSSA